MMTRRPLIVDIVPLFKAGDPRPDGYVEWFEWSDVQHKAGLRQKRCKKCGLWRYPQELAKDGQCK